MIKRKVLLLLSVMIFSANGYAVSTDNLNSTLTKSITSKSKLQASSNVLYGGRDHTHVTIVSLLPENSLPIYC